MIKIIAKISVIVMILPILMHSTTTRRAFEIPKHMAETGPAGPVAKAF